MRFVLIPGADGRAWYWHRLIPLLEARGHHVAAVDLPVGDATAGLEEHAAAVLAAIGPDARDVVLVAQSLAGFIAPLVADRVPVAQLVLVNAMVPRPGESAGAWWAATDQEQARREHYVRAGLELPAEFDPLEAFFHDVPPDVAEKAMAMGAGEQRFDTLFAQPWPLAGWPNVPTRFLQGRDDRFLPLEFQRRVVADRLGLPVEELPGGHLAALSHREELAAALTARQGVLPRADRYDVPPDIRVTSSKRAAP